MKSLRTGIGYDVHQLKAGVDLWIGGIRIAHNKGAVGHSDADVLIHAICDALLGAANLGDIGQHFSDEDPAFEGVDSKKLLAHVVDLISKHEYHIVNVDSTIILERPKLAPYLDSMKETLVPIMKIRKDLLSIKATTSEQMGFIGNEEGIAAMATVLIMFG